MLLCGFRRPCCTEDGKKGYEHEALGPGWLRLLGGVYLEDCKGRYSFCLLAPAFVALFLSLTDPLFPSEDPGICTGCVLVVVLGPSEIVNQGVRPCWPEMAPSLKKADQVLTIPGI